MKNVLFIMLGGAVGSALKKTQNEGVTPIYIPLSGRNALVM